MKLAIINGSPRGKGSNSKRITDWMTSVFDSRTKTVEIFVRQTNRSEENIERIADCDAYLFIFPLYTDAMPGVTKEFMEEMEKSRPHFEGKPIYFIIHSGFPESSQSLAVQRYTHKFTKLLGMEYMGGIRMGGSEALQAAPDSYFRKKKESYEFLAGNLERLEPFDSEHSEYLSRSRKPGAIMRFIVNHTKLNDMYWNNAMKKNGVYNERFARPYVSEDKAKHE